MLTLQGDTQAALGSDSIEPVILVVFTISGTSYKFTNTSNHSVADVNSACLGSIGTISSEIDPFTRKFSRSNYTLTFADDQGLRDVISDNFFRNVDCDIKLGAPGIGEANFVVIEKCLTQDYRISGAAIVVDAVSKYYSLLNDAEVWDAIVDHHPIDAMVKIFGAINMPSSFYDATSFNPDTYASSAHFNVSRFNMKDYFKKWRPAQDSDENLLGWADVNSEIAGEKAADLIDQLSEVMTGMIRPDEAGVYEFSRLDIDGASVRTLTTDDISDLHQISGGDMAYSTVRVRMGTELGLDPMVDFGFTDVTSEAGFNNFTDATGDTGSTLIIDNKWLYPVGKLAYTTPTSAPDYGFLSSTATHMYAACAGTTGYAGLAFSENGDTATSDYSTRLAAGRNLTASRYAYLLIVGQSRYRYTTVGTPDADFLAARSDEVVRVDQAVYFYPSGATPQTTTLTGISSDHDQNSVVERAGAVYPGPSALVRFQFDTAAAGNGRGQFSSSTPNFWKPGALVYDVTEAVDMLNHRVDRAAYGIPKISCTLSMKHVDLQPGDIVQVVHNQILAYGIDGSDLGVFWEVLRTELSLGASPGVRVTLGYLRGRNSGVTPPTPSYEVSGNSSPDGGGNQDGTDPLTQLDYTIITDSAGEIMYAG